MKVSSASWSEEAAALRTEVQRLSQQLDALRAQCEPKEKEEKYNKIENLYTYAAHVAITGSPLRCLCACFMVGVVQVLIALFAFAYFDSSWLSRHISEQGFPQFGSIHPGNFYAGKFSSLDFQSDRLMAGTDLPQIVSLAALIGVLLLVSITRSEDVETLQTPFPLAIVIFHPHVLRKSIWRVVPLVFILFCWMLRALWVPLCLNLGVAFALASSGNAQDIVINSIAAGFLFDLDSMAYTILVSVRHRAEYEAVKPPPGCPLAVEGADVVIEVYTRLMWAAGAFFSVFFLFEADPTDTGFIIRCTEIALLVRGAIFGFAQAHIAWICSRGSHRSGSNDESKASVGVLPAGASRCSHVLLGLGLLTIVGVTTLCGALLYQFHRGVLDTRLGWRYYTDMEPCLQACLHTFPGATNGSVCYSGILFNRCGPELDAATDAYLSSSYMYGW